MVRQSLELIHSDMCGPMPERSLGGTRYFITFINDYTHKVWAYSIKSKDKVLETFARWTTEGEHRSDHKVKTFLPNNGGEYTSKSLRQVPIQKRNPESMKHSLHPDAEWCSRTNEPDNSRKSDDNAPTRRTQAGILGESGADYCILDKSLAV